MSMQVLKYWKERLDNAAVFYREHNYQLPHSMLLESPDIRHWPLAINTMVMYDDFLAWHHDRYIKPLSDDYPVPKPAHVRLFFSILKDFLFIAAHSNPRMRRVPVPRMLEGTVFMERRYQRFIFLRNINEMRAQYETLTI